MMLHTVKGTWISMVTGSSGVNGLTGRQSVSLKIDFFSSEPGGDASPEAKKNFMKYEYPLSSYIRVGVFSPNGLAEGHVPQDIGKVSEMRIRVWGHNSESWIILSEVKTV